MSDTPRTDREVYTISERDIGFQAVGATLCRMIERELAAALRLQSCKKPGAEDVLKRLLALVPDMWGDYVMEGNITLTIDASIIDDAQAVIGGQWNQHDLMYGSRHQVGRNEDAPAAELRHRLSDMCHEYELVAGKLITATATLNLIAKWGNHDAETELPAMAARLVLAKIGEAPDSRHVAGKKP